MKKVLWLVLLLVAVATIACSMNRATAKPTATAIVEPRSDSNVSGTVKFTEDPGGEVTIKVDLTGLTPGAHGFHVHETGDCSAPDAKSAGGHFAPNNEPHGAPTAEHHHAGDFGSVVAGTNGEVHTQMTTRQISVSPGPTSVVGRAVVIHADPDDLTSQPSGNAGKRVGCGVISLTSVMMQ